MANKYPFPPDFKTIYEKADLLVTRTENLTKKLRAFYFYTYLSGTRISEALDLQYNNIQFNSVQGIDLCFATIFTRKNKVKTVRVIPISYTSPYEKKMFSEFAEIYSHSIDYVFKDLIQKEERYGKGYDKNLRELRHIKKDGSETIKEFKDPYASTKTRLERYFKKIEFETPVLNTAKKTMNVEKYKLHPHLLRHFRASHLYGLYRVKREDMIEIFGWSDDRPLQIYTAMYPNELAKSYADTLNNSIKKQGA
jgi:integrase